jgi:hypothetical protein
VGPSIRRETASHARFSAGMMLNRPPLGTRSRTRRSLRAAPIQVIRTVARQVPFDCVRVVLASTEGDVRFLEVLENPVFRNELQDSLREGFLPLGMLGWEMTADTLQPKRKLFAWHRGDEALEQLFRRLSEDGFGGVGELPEVSRGGGSAVYSGLMWGLCGVRSHAEKRRGPSEKPPKRRAAFSIRPQTE